MNLPLVIPRCIDTSTADDVKVILDCCVTLIFDQSNRRYDLR